MINHNGNFPNLDGIENGGLSGLSNKAAAAGLLQTFLTALMDHEALFFLEMLLTKRGEVGRWLTSHHST